jgi:hypothetical protein
MARTHKKVRYSPKSKGKEYTPLSAAQDVEQAFKVLEGRWKLLMSTPEQKCISWPEQKYIGDAGNKAPELGAFS